MEFFLDTANLDQIRHWQDYGLVQGVTTNPALLAKEGVDPIVQIQRIAGLVTDGPISAEVTQVQPDRMIAQGKRLAGLAPNVIIKVPADKKGYLTAKALKAAGIRTNITLVFHASQAIPFMQLGCDYISLFIGRVDDFGFDNADAVVQARDLVRAMGSPSKVLAASIRNSTQLVRSIQDGAQVVTVPPGTWEKIYKQPMYQAGDADFMRAWQSLPDDVRRDYDTM